MGCQVFDMPVTPAKSGRFDLVDLGCLSGTRHKPVRLAERVLGNSRPRQSDFRAVLQKGTSPNSAALAASPTARKNQAARSSVPDHAEMPAVRPRNRIGVELMCWQHMIWQDRVIAISSRPTAIGQAQ